MTVTYTLCDVFASQPFSGNSLPVFIDPPHLSPAQMLTITRELRQFESIFVQSEHNETTFAARVFDLLEELPFAGHPIIGAACVMHLKIRPQEEINTVWTVSLANNRNVTVHTTRTDDGFFGTLDQGAPIISKVLDKRHRAAFSQAFGLVENDLASLPLQVISTGLRYLIIPVSSGLARARISVPDMEKRLAEIGADYAYLLDPRSFEGRHWNNDGVVEDIATGSAAGPAGVYAVLHGLAEAGAPIRVRQGHFINRPSTLSVTVIKEAELIKRVEVGGPVSIVGDGSLVAMPPERRLSDEDR